MQVLAAMISSNVVMPAFSAANRDESKPMGSQYRNVQIVSDAVIVTAAGILAVAGPAIVRLLFDHRYTSAGTVLSCFAIGVVGMRYYVVEQLMNADGNFKLTSLLAIVKLICLAAGTYLGFHLGGLTGAAVAVGISTFAGWPGYIGYLRKTIGIQWRAEALVPVFLLAGAGMGLLASKIISLYR